MKNFKQRDDKRGGFGGGRGGRNDRGGRSDDKPVFFGKSRGGDRSTDREQKMFKAICSDCRKSCDVPFKPSNDKPVFCRDCFSAKRDRETREYKAGLKNGSIGTFSNDKTVAHTGSTHTPFVVPQVDEATKKQIADMNSKIEKLTLMLEKMIEEKKVVEVSAEVVKTRAISKVQKVAQKKAPSVAKKAITVKPVAAKKTAKTATKAVVVKKVAVKKATVVAKSAPKKKVVAKKGK